MCQTRRILYSVCNHYGSRPYAIARPCAAYVLRTHKKTAGTLSPEEIIRLKTECAKNEVVISEKVQKTCSECMKLRQFEILKKANTIVSTINCGDDVAEDEYPFWATMLGEVIQHLLEIEGFPDEADEAIATAVVYMAANFAGHQVKIMDILDATQSDITGPAVYCICVWCYENKQALLPARFVDNKWGEYKGIPFPKLNS